MMNVYIGKALSNIVIVTQRAPPGVIKPPPEKLAATSINKPPKSQTPASNAGTTGICAVTWPDSFTTKNAINIIKGHTTVTMPTSRPLKLEPRRAWTNISGNQKAAAPTSINFRRRAQFIDDHSIALMINIIKGTHDRDDAYVPSVEVGTPQSVDEYIRQPEGSRADQHQFQKARPVYR